MKVRWIRRYKPIVYHTGEIHSELVLQEWVRIESAISKSLIGEKWVDVEIFDDLESKEEAITELQKLGINVPLKR